MSEQKSSEKYAGYRDNQLATATEHKNRAKFAIGYTAVSAILFLAPTVAPMLFEVEGILDTFPGFSTSQEMVNLGMVASGFVASLICGSAWWHEKYKENLALGYAGGYDKARREREERGD
jgi:hypothetical protein